MDIESGAIREVRNEFQVREPIARFTKGEEYCSGEMQQRGCVSFLTIKSLRTSLQTVEATATPAGAVAVLATATVSGPTTLSTILSVATQVLRCS